MELSQSQDIDLFMELTQEQEEKAKDKYQCLVTIGNDCITVQDKYSVKDILQACGINVNGYLDGTLPMTVHPKLNNIFFTDDYYYIDEKVKQLISFHLLENITTIILQYLQCATLRHCLLNIQQPAMIDLSLSPKPQMKFFIAHFNEFHEVTIDYNNVAECMTSELCKTNLLEFRAHLQLQQYDDTMDQKINLDKFKTIEELRHFVIKSNIRQEMDDFMKLSVYSGCVQLYAKHPDIPFPSIETATLYDYVLWEGFGRLLHEYAKFKHPEETMDFYAIVEFDCGKKTNTFALSHCTGEDFETLRTSYENLYNQRYFKKMIHLISRKTNFVPCKSKEETKFLLNLSKLNINEFKKKHPIVQVWISRIHESNYTRVKPSRTNISCFMNELVIAEPDLIQQLNWKHNELKGVVYPEHEIFNHILRECVHSYDGCPINCPFRALPSCFIDPNLEHYSTNSFVDIQCVPKLFEHIFFKDVKSLAKVMEIGYYQDIALKPVCEWMQNPENKAIFKMPSLRLGLTLVLVSLVTCVTKKRISVYSPVLFFEKAKIDPMVYTQEKIIEVLRSHQKINREHIIFPFCVNGMFEKLEQILPLSFIELDNLFARDLLELAVHFEYLDKVDTEAQADICLFEV